MDKITQLLDIIEHPEKYSDEILERMLSDEQLCQNYEIMALASSAYHARRAKEHDPDDVDAAWKEFQSRTTVSTHHKWWRSAAIIIGIMVSGLAIAALWPFWHMVPKAEPIETTQKTRPIPANSTTPKENLSHTESQPQPTAKKIVFDNVSLEQIIQETADFYGMSYSFDREEPRRLRLHVKWDQQQPMDSFVSRLNQFEKFTIIINDNTIIIK